MANRALGVLYAKILSTSFLIQISTITILLLKPQDRRYLAIIKVKSLLTNIWLQAMINIIY
jgi:hypothetical protein